MKLIVILITLLALISPSLVSQTGGYILVGEGWTDSHGISDFLVYRLDVDGTILWGKLLGGTGAEGARRVVQIMDGNFIVAGASNTYTHGERDILVYKLDGDGNKLWRKNYGGVYDDAGIGLAATSDGGFIVGGDTYSYITGTTSSDMLLYKLNSAGQKQWRKNYGGASLDRGPSEIVQTSDGGYIMCGDSLTYGVGGDFLVYKLDAGGDKQWRKSYGGSEWDTARSIQQTPDGGYILSGYGQSYSNGGYDFLVYKLDAGGAKQWRKNYGGIENDNTNSVKQTADNGFILAGTTTSYNQGADDTDILVYKLDPAGNKQWRKNLGGVYDESGTCVQLTPDGGYILAGTTRTYVHGTPDYDFDFIVYKLNTQGMKQWRQNYGGTNSEHGEWIEVVPN